MYMLVYLWAQNPQLIIPREEFPARKPSLPPAGAKGRAGAPLPPAEEALSGAEAEPRTSPGPASCCRRNEEAPNPSTASPEPVLAGCLRRHADTGGSRTLPRTAIRWKYSLLGGQGKGKESKPSFLLFFVSIWERLQARSLKSHLRCFRAKTNSPHDKINR